MHQSHKKWYLSNLVAFNISLGKDLLVRSGLVSERSTKLSVSREGSGHFTSVDHALSAASGGDSLILSSDNVLYL